MPVTNPCDRGKMCGSLLVFTKRRNCFLSSSVGLYRLVTGPVFEQGFPVGINNAKPMLVWLAKSIKVREGTNQIKQIP